MYITATNYLQVSIHASPIKNWICIIIIIVISTHAGQHNLNSMLSHQCNYNSGWWTQTRHNLLVQNITHYCHNKNLRHNHRRNNHSTNQLSDNWHLQRKMTKQRSLKIIMRWGIWCHKKRKKQQKIKRKQWWSARKKKESTAWYQQSQTTHQRKYCPSYEPKAALL